MTHAGCSTFTYDSAGNRLTNKKNGATTTFTYDMADQLSTSVDGSGTTTYTYDNAGNQTLVVAPGSQRTTSTWNDENKRTRVQTPGGTTMDCEYRFDGLRYEKQASGATTRFLYDGQNYLAETDGTGSVKLVLTNKPNGYGSLISQYVNIFGSTFVPVYQHYDALGSTAAITTSAQAVVNSYHYGAWGDIVSSTEGIFNNFKWVGELGYYYDMQVEDYYVRARNYSPRQARWYSQDPIGLRGGLNQSRYAGNPVSSVDPTGKECSSADCISRCDGRPVIVGGPGGVVGVSDPRQQCIDKCKHAETKFNEWYQKQIENGKPNYTSLPACPCSIRCSKTTCWDLIRGHSGHDVPCSPPGFYLVPPRRYPIYLQKYHPGASWDLRSEGSPSQQCTYDADFNLITSGPGVGTVDDRNSKPVVIGGHIGADVYPVDLVITLQGSPLKEGCWFEKYLKVRPAIGGKPCRKTSAKYRNRWWKKW